MQTEPTLKLILMEEKTSLHTTTINNEPSSTMDYSISGILRGQPIGSYIVARRSRWSPRTLEIAVHHPAYQMDLDVTKMPPDTSSTPRAVLLASLVGIVHSCHAVRRIPCLFRGRVCLRHSKELKAAPNWRMDPIRKRGTAAG